MLIPSQIAIVTATVLFATGGAIAQQVAWMKAESRNPGRQAPIPDSAGQQVTWMKA